MTATAYRIVPYCQTEARPECCWIEYLHDAHNNIWLPIRDGLGIWETRHAAEQDIKRRQTGIKLKTASERRAFYGIPKKARRA